MNLDEILIFTKVVEAGSLTEAARQLGLPKSTVSRKLSQLESRLGVRLLQRTTRSQHLTDLGQNFHAQVGRVIHELEEAERDVLAANQKVQGHLRISVPVEMGMFHMAAIVDGFLQEHPEVSLELELSDRMVNLIDEGYDLTIRAGILEDSSLIASRLLDLELKLYASPEYLDRQGRPGHPDELAGHECICFPPAALGNRWRLSRGSESREFAIHSRRTTNSMMVAQDWLCAGRGIGVLTRSGAEKLLEEGRLQAVLPDWSAGRSSLYLIYPSRRLVPQKLRVFLEYLRDYFAVAGRTG